MYQIPSERLNKKYKHRALLRAHWENCNCFLFTAKLRFSKLVPKSLRIGAQLSAAVSLNLHTHNLGEQRLQFSKK